MTGFPLYLLRHGAPETPGLLMGRTDGAPTHAGIAACIEQADGLDIQMIVSSDLSRARRAAEAIGETLGLPVTLDPRWRELDFGAWDGLDPKVIDPEAIARFWDDPDSCPPPGGERWSIFVERVAKAIAALDPRPTLVITHGGAMRATLAHLCGFALPQLWTFELSYNALLSLKVWPGEQPSGQIIGLWP